MNTTDVEEICRIARIDPTYYSIGSERHESLCLTAQGEAWHVFLSDRGERFEDRVFDSEDQVSVYFLKRLFRLWG